MWQTTKLAAMHSTAQCLLNHPATAVTVPSPPNHQIPTISPPTPPCVLKNSLKLSRRELTICTKTSLLLVLSSQQFQLPKARAEEENSTTETNVSSLEGDNSDNTIIGDENPITVESNAAPQEADSSEISTTAEENQENSTDAAQQEADSSEIPTTAEKNQENATNAVADSSNNPITVDENPATTETNAAAGNEADSSNNLTTVEENPPANETNAAAAQEADSSENATTNSGCSGRSMKKRAFFDVSINGESIGRIVLGLYDNNAPITTARFSNIISGAAGISYRRKEFIKILPNYIQHGGVRSYGVDADLAKKTGSSLSNERLIAELEKSNESCPGTKNVATSVSIIVRDPLKPPPKMKLVARKGKLEIDEEEIGKDPNGTEFVISTKDSPELDASALVVGRVLEGMEVVEKIGQVKTVQDNTSSPYFRTAKLIGDKRAVVAERGFNRPYSKCGVRAVLKTSWTELNPGRRFWRCPLYTANGRRGCNFLQWLDPEPCNRCSTVIPGLLRKIVVLENENERRAKKERKLLIALVVCVLWILLLLSNNGNGDGKQLYQLDK